MIEACVAAYKKYGPTDGLGIIPISVLTSFTDDECHATYGTITRSVAVKRFAHWVEKAGAYGIVCSPQDLLPLQGLFPGLKRVTPGSRSLGKATHDQACVDTPANALKNGADFLVFGRQVREAEDPVTELDNLNAELTTAA
jgi:orotidine-5'-phosphate decarboxylase